MKSKKLNKLARRGLTAALAGAMVLSMAAPAMAAVSPASGTAVAETTKQAATPSIDLYQVDKTTTKTASGNNSTTYTIDYNKKLATDGLTMTYVNGKADGTLFDSSIIAGVGTEGTGKVEHYNVIISDANLIQLADDFGVNSSATYSNGKDTNAAVKTEITGRGSQDEIKKGTRPIEVVYSNISATELDTKPLRFVQTGYDVSNYLEVDNSKPVTITVVGVDSKGQTVKSVTRTVTVNNQREAKAIGVNTNSERFVLANGVLNVDLDKFWKSNDDAVANEKHVIPVYINDGIDDTNADFNVNDYDVKVEDSSIAEVIPFESSNVNYNAADVTYTGTNANQANTFKKFFNLRPLKEGTTKITITRRAHGKIASATQTITLNVEDTSIGLSVAYNHAKDGTETQDSNWNSYRRVALADTTYTPVEDTDGYLKNSSYSYGNYGITGNKSLNPLQKYDVLNSTVVTYAGNFTVAGSNDTGKVTLGSKGMFLDIVKNTSGKITATAKNSKNVKITYDVPAQYQSIISCDNDGNITVTADQFSFTDANTEMGVYVNVIATSTVNKGADGKYRTEIIKVPVSVAKFAYSYANVTNASEYGQKTLKTKASNGTIKPIPFIGNSTSTYSTPGYTTTKASDSEYYKKALIPVYDADSKGSEYYLVDDGNGTVVVNGQTVKPDYFKQLSTKDNKEWTINLDTNVDSKYITYSSSNSQVASVENGKVTANKPGTAIITVSANASSTTSGKTYRNDVKKILVNVTDKYQFNKITAPSVITVDGTNKTVAIGATADNADATNLIYGLYTKNGDGTYSAIDDDKDGYADQNTDHITVSNNGYVTYKKGTGTVYVGIGVKPNAKTLNSVTSDLTFVQVNYNKGIANEIKVDGAATTSVGNTVDVTATTTTPGTFSVKSSDDTVATATVDAAGKITITGVKAGKATITVSNKATDTSYADPKDATIDVTVTNNSLTVDPVSLHFKTPNAAAQTITAKTDAPAGVKFTSDNTAVATVADDGTVTPKKAGKTNITVTAGTETVKVPVVIDITVAKPTGLKVKNVKTKAIKVTAKKKGTISGYKVSYEVPSGKKTSSTTDGTWKVRTVKCGNKNLNVTIKGLKKGTYKVKVRAYRKTGGKTYFSKYTSVKKVTIKK